jgi:hypothetical protein
VFKERSSSSRRCGNCEPQVQGSVGKPFFGFSTEPSVSTMLFASVIRLRYSTKLSHKKDAPGSHLGQGPVFFLLNLIRS